MNHIISIHYITKAFEKIIDNIDNIIMISLSFDIMLFGSISIVIRPCSLNAFPCYENIQIDLTN